MNCGLGGGGTTGRLAPRGACKARLHHRGTPPLGDVQKELCETAKASWTVYFFSCGSQLYFRLKKNRFCFNDAPDGAHPESIVHPHGKEATESLWNVVTPFKKLEGD